MSESRLFENHEVNDLVLKYADPKYKYALLRDIGDHGEKYIWLLSETLEDAERRLKIETLAYIYDEDENDLENYNFVVAEIFKSVFKGKRKDNISISLHDIEGLNSAEIRLT